jgi:glutamate-1-semialdehyde 2,1-aminomutase
MREDVVRAERVIPLGVSSPLRACRNVEIEPLVIGRAQGEILFDVDGRKFIDFMYGFGPLILGHSPECISKALHQQIDTGMVYGTASNIEVELAEKVVESSDFIDQVRFVCSGTEAVMSAVRLARAFTSKTKVLRFEGGYHGHFDLVQNKGEEKYIDAGLDPRAMDANIIAEFNNIDSVASLFKKFPNQIACVLIEPLPCNMSLVFPKIEFLKELKKLCKENGALLIFDEVISGFRFCFGPVSNLLGVDPDLVTFGKIIGGGTPIGAFGGRKEIMRLLETQQILQGGTFAGNQLTMAAGVATLEKLLEPGFYEELEKKGKFLENAIDVEKKRLKLDFIFARKGSVFAFIFLPEGSSIQNASDIGKQTKQIYTSIYQTLRSKGYHLTPDVEEVLYVSDATKYETLTKFAKDACEAISKAH